MRGFYLFFGGMFFRIQRNAVLREQCGGDALPRDTASCVGAVVDAGRTAARAAILEDRTDQGAFAAERERQLSAAGVFGGAINADIADDGTGAVRRADNLARVTRCR